MTTRLRTAAPYGRMRRVRRPPRIALLTLTLLAAGAIAAGAGQDGQGLPVRGAVTPSPAETIETLEIKRDAGAGRRVAMSLGPAQLPRLQRGDRLRFSGEVQITTTCVDSSERCIGRAYDFSPTAGARLVLGRGRRAVGGQAADTVSPRETVTCHQRRPNRNHHCVIVIREASKTVHNLGRLPCGPGDCHLNLVLDAHHPSARDGHVIVVGADRPDGSIEQGKGRLSALLLRADPRPPARTNRSENRVRDSIPIGSERSGGNLVTHSVKLPNLREGDVVTADALQRTGIGHLPYSAFVSTQMILTDSRRRAHAGSFAQRIADRPALGEQNGFNCTQG